MIKVDVRQGWDALGVEIIIWEEMNGKIYVVKPMQLIFEECPDGFAKEPSLRIPATMAQTFLQSFAEVLDRHGVKTDKDAKIQGTLEATRYHLEDLREMLKLTATTKNGEERGG